MLLRTPLAATLALIAALSAGAPVPVLAQTPMRDAPSSFRPLAQQLLPAVVSIQVSSAVQARAGNRPDAPEVPQAPPGSPFEDFFREFFDRQQRPNAQPRRTTSLGSGFVIDASGEAPVENHLVPSRHR